MSPDIPKHTSFWPKTLSEWAEVVGAVFVILVAACSATLYIGSLMVDKHIQSALKPINENVNQITGDVRELKGALSVLRAQNVAEKYSTAAPTELHAHRAELSNIKKDLAATPSNAPNFWPTSFLIITLFSRASFDVERVAATPESTFDNVGSNPPGAFGMISNKRVALINLVQGMVFKDSIVRFDPSVRLVNDVFIDCVFIFPVVETPPRPLQEIGKALLASDLSKVTLNSS
jgi:hypothetical protein